MHRRYRILDKDLKRVQDALMHNSSPTLAYVFALSKKIELNMTEEKVVMVGFNINPTTSSSGQRKTTKWEWWKEVVVVNHDLSQVPEGQVEENPYPHLLVNNSGPSCWTCGGAHLRRDCPQENSGQASEMASQSSQASCDHCGRAGHTMERCFDLHCELRSERGRGGAVQGG